MKFPPLALAGLLAIAMIATPISIVALTGGDDRSDGRHGVHARDDRSAPGREHARQMREWARCVAEARRGKQEAKSSPVEACGERPLPPGLLKRMDRDGHGLPGLGHRKHDKLPKMKGSKDKANHGRGMPRGPDRE